MTDDNRPMTAAQGERIIGKPRIAFTSDSAGMWHKTWTLPSQPARINDRNAAAFLQFLLQGVREFKKQHAADDVDSKNVAVRG